VNEHIGNPLYIISAESYAPATEVPGISRYCEWALTLPGTVVVLVRSAENERELSRYERWLWDRGLGASERIMVYTELEDGSDPGLLTVLLKRTRKMNEVREHIRTSVRAGQSLHFLMTNDLVRRFVDDLGISWEQTNNLAPEDAGVFDTLHNAYRFLEEIGVEALPSPHRFCSSEEEIVDAVTLIHSKISQVTVEVSPSDLAGGAKRLFLLWKDTHYSATIRTYLRQLRPLQLRDFLVRPCTLPNEAMEASFHFALPSRATEYVAARLTNAAGVHVGSILFKEQLSDPRLPIGVFERLRTEAWKVRDNLPELIPIERQRGYLGINFTLEQHPGVMAGGRIATQSGARSVIVTNVKTRCESEMFAASVARQLGWEEGFCVLQAAIDLPVKINNWGALIAALGDLALDPTTHKGVVPRIPFPTDNPDWPYRTHIIALVRGGKDEALVLLERTAEKVGGREPCKA